MTGQNLWIRLINHFKTENRCEKRREWKSDKVYGGSVLDKVLWFLNDSPLTDSRTFAPSVSITVDVSDTKNRNGFSTFNRPIKYSLVFVFPVRRCLTRLSLKYFPLFYSLKKKDTIFFSVGFPLSPSIVFIENRI